MANKKILNGTLIPSIVDTDALEISKGNTTQYYGTIAQLKSVFGECIDYSKTIFLSPDSGDDTNSGLNPCIPVKTYAQARTLAQALTPSSSNIINIVIADSSTLDEDVTLDQYINLIAPNSDFNGASRNIVLNQDTIMVFRDIKANDVDKNGAGDTKVFCNDMDISSSFSVAGTDSVAYITVAGDVIADLGYNGFGARIDVSCRGTWTGIYSPGPSGGTVIVKEEAPITQDVWDNFLLLDQDVSTSGDPTFTGATIPTIDGGDTGSDTLDLLGNSTLSNHLKLNADGTSTLYGLASYNSHPTITADEDIIDKKYFDDNIPQTAFFPEQLTVTSNGQTSFTLTNGTPISDNHLWFTVNGQTARDFTRIGQNITWTGASLKTTDEFYAFYFVNLSAIGTVKEIWAAGTDYSNNNDNYRTKTVGGGGGHRFTFKVPDDFNNLVSFYLWGQVSSGADGSGKDIDLASSYGGEGEALNFHSEADTTTNYDFTGFADQNNKLIDLSIIATQLAAGDWFSVFVDHKGIGGGIDYLGIQLLYT